MAIEYLRCGESKLRWAVSVQYTPDFKAQYVYEFYIAAVKNYDKFNDLKHPFIITVL